MLKISKRQRIEFQVILGLTGIAVLNILIFTGISIGETFKGGLFQVDSAVMIYGVSIFIMVLLALLRRLTLLSYVFYFLLAYTTANIISNLYILIVNPHISDNGAVILSEALLIWLTSLLVFTFWYWLVDRGGPVERSIESDETRYDLLFPQYQSKIPGWEKWHPHFIDYLFFSFFTSTGFSPADTLPLTKRAKFLMMIEASVSLIIIGMVAARAISLI